MPGKDVTSGSDWDSMPEAGNIPSKSVPSKPVPSKAPLSKSAQPQSVPLTTVPQNSKYCNSRTYQAILFYGSCPETLLHISLFKISSFKLSVFNMVTNFNILHAACKLSFGLHCS